jgi:predicted HAD superfamily phosphohydrolase
MVLATDVEGPLFLGDFIDEAMSEMVKPDGAIDVVPKYGKILYAQTWQWFNDTTKERRGINPYSRSSVSQEGEDTLFTLPIFLACGVTQSYLDNMTLRSQPTPGSYELVKALEAQGVLVVGVTTAPQDSYRKLVTQTGLLDPRQIIGSSFPLDEMKTLLEETGLYDEEIRMTNDYLEECFDIIDEHSDISCDRGKARRDLSDEGKEILRQRIARFHDQQLGINYEAGRRASPRNISAIGIVIEASRIIGDRGKRAVAQQLSRRYLNPGGVLVTEGDGLNDSLMLQSAPYSIGLNGVDAALAAKIGVITEDRRDELPIFEAIASGETNIDKIVEYAQSKVDSETIIHRAGPDTDPSLLEKHAQMKKRLRGQLIY